MFGVIEKKNIQDSGYLERNGNLEKLKKLLPELKGFDCIHWGGWQNHF